MTFDISHVLRRPVTNLLGLTNLISYEKENLPKEVSECVNNIRAVSEELETFTRELEVEYTERKMKAFSNSLKID